MEDLEDDPRRVGGHGRGLPDEDVSDEGGSSNEVTRDGGEAAHGISSSSGDIMEQLT